MSEPESSKAVSAASSTSAQGATTAEPQHQLLQDEIQARSPSTSQPTIKVYKPVAGGSTTTRLPELPDSYYNPTASELRAAHAGQANRLRSLGVDTNFSTRAQRDKEARQKEQKRVNRFPKTAIRIRFADRHTIETHFPSSRNIQAVYDFVKSILREDIQSQPFVLSIPPRLELKPADPKTADKSLLDLQLAPSSLLIIRFTADESLNDPSKQAPLRPSLFDLAEDLPKPPSFDPTPEQFAAASSSGKEDITSSEEKKGNTLGGGGAKAPKWLQKVSGKK